MDERFKHIATDPKFRRAPRNKKNVKIDKRFQSMFHSKKFKGSAKVDMRGKPINHSVDKDLKKYYEINSDESDSDAEKQEEEDGEAELKVKHKTDKEIPKKIVKKLKDMDVDYARGEGYLYSDSSSDDEESDEEIEEIEHGWGELDADAEETDEVTHRLAACNMDWDRIRAVDLLVLMTSFLPPGGSIISVNIYPSEFGKQRMAEEDIKGPKELVSSNDQYEVDDDDEENEEGSKYHMEKLRQYQLNRLKYYYAVITFDSDNSANKVYTECDGMEYESSATKMDLRFIPDDMTFDDAPKESCDKLPDTSRYEPRFFTTTALQQSKVDLTWDETNQDRKELTEKLAKGKIDDISEADLQNYLASSSGEESEEEKPQEKDNSVDSDDSDMESNENPIDKYKALLAGIEEKEKEKKNRDIGMEISWGIDVQEKTDQLIKKKKEENQDKTPFQEYLDKRNKKRKEKTKLKKQNAQDDDSSEDNDDMPSDIDMNDPYFAEEFDKPEFKKKSKKKIEDNEEDMDEQKQAELELLLLNEGDDEKKHFSLKKIQEQENDKKSKKKKKKSASAAEPVDDFKVNVNDERFSALFTSHHYNIEPTNPHYKKTKAMETLISEKLKRRAGDEEENEAKRHKQDNKKQSAELSVLVKSVKRKAQEFGKKKNK
ncbi:PREDICTED: ESF1 homolog [Nicrophorus vespilloides]|uniref:ESF1 homolog n=1 Tax=Nicrophorus vespilloides TaxID=110193 RepID=A0ABM1MH85_NICVS|nr:PREDICTED: ESF1 homolog [Nicrophorus vespilloides]